jgi:hypothetical protein
MAFTYSVNRQFRCKHAALTDVETAIQTSAMSRPKLSAVAGSVPPVKWMGVMRSVKLSCKTQPGEGEEPDIIGHSAQSTNGKRRRLTRR